MTVTLECRHEPPHTHEFPDDWEFAGPTGDDPRADKRWRGTTYEYLNARLDVIAVSQVPICDDAALDYFTRVNDFGPGYCPKFVQAKRPNGDVDLLEYQYDLASDTVFPMGA